jgi:acyl carrier protein
MDRKALLNDYIKSEFMRNKNAKLDENEDLLSAGILDSIAILQLVAYIEKALAIEMPDEDVIYDNFKSINSLVSYLKKF